MSNFQPQPAWISASTAETGMRIRAFIRSVYAWMFGGLLLTAFASVWVVSSPAMQQLVRNPMVLIVLIIAEFGLVFGISAGLRRFSAATAASMFLVYALLNGLTLSFIFFAYTASSIVQAFVVAGGMFGAMSVYGMVTKRDLTSWGSFFFMGLIGIVICAVVNLFVHSSVMSFVISIIGVFVFVGLTAWDTQKLKSYATVGGPMQENLAIFGALALYLDFVNLFLFLLRILGDRRR
ncbi:MAG TPA: Bax inhibitor-1/YccA family protein [Thermoanaerobaculia bacterium]|nr:Bax inhibitor-1/YccA family protein [Thermoanaerobaculia bacterium]